MTDEFHFHAYANATLQHIFDQLEQAYDDESLEDLDYDEGSGILSIVTPSGQTFIVSKHGPSQQLWLASPISGGLHADFNESEQEWLLPDGRDLKDVLAEDLVTTAGIRIRL
mgnify:FL=1